VHQECTKKLTPIVTDPPAPLNRSPTKLVETRLNVLVGQGYRQALLGLGETFDANGQPDEALKDYDKFLALQPGDRNKAIAHANRGAALAHIGKDKEALAEYQQALEYAPGDVLILVFKSVEAAKAGNLDAGITELQSVVSGNLGSDSLPFAFLQLGTLLQEKGEWRRAIVEFRKATELQPNYEEAHHALAYALAHEGRQSEALSEYTKIAKLSNSEFDRTYPEFIANQWLGNTLRDQGNDAAAASAYRQAIRLEPEYGIAHCWLGVVLERQGYVSQAIEQYRIASSDVKSKALDDRGVGHHCGV
jgi:protein O-GlcNAc transferase